MLTITTNRFENDVLRADKPVLVDFWAQDRNLNIAFLSSNWNCAGNVDLANRNWIFHNARIRQ